MSYDEELGYDPYTPLGFLRLLWDLIYSYTIKPIKIRYYLWRFKSAMLAYQRVGRFPVWERFWLTVWAKWLGRNLRTLKK